MREALPIKNWRGLPAPITDGLQDKLTACVGTYPNSISYNIKDAMETNGIFMKQEAGAEEMRKVYDKYKIALGKMTAMAPNPACEYGVLGNKFRMVKLAKDAKRIYDKLRGVIATLTKSKGGEVDRVIKEVIASTLAQYEGKGPGSRPLLRGGLRKTRRHRKRVTRRR